MPISPSHLFSVVIPSLFLLLVGSLIPTKGPPMYTFIYYKYNNSYLVVNTATKKCTSSRSVLKSAAAAISTPIEFNYAEGSLLGDFLAGKDNPNFQILATSETPFSADTHPELLI